MKKGNLILLVISFFCIECDHTEKISCFNKYLEEVKKEKEYEIVKQGLSDTLKAWIDRGLYEVQYYKVNKPKWKIDEAVFFNKSRTKCLLLILIQDGDTISNEDYVKIIGAEKINEKWQYYYVSYVDYIYYRENNNFHVFSFKSLSSDVIKDIVEDGYVKNSLIGCSINYGYIDESELWFADWRRVMHKEFLEGTLPRNPFGVPHSRP